MHVVYGLQDPRDNDVYARYIQHIRCEDRNAAKNERIHELKALGMLPIPLTLETVHSLEAGQKRELYWIAHYRHLGMVLCNVKRQPPVKEHREQITEREINKALAAYSEGARGPRALQKALGCTYYHAQKLSLAINQSVRGKGN